MDEYKDLAKAKQDIEKVFEFIRKYPNDMELGRKLRDKFKDDVFKG